MKDTCTELQNEIAALVEQKKVGEHGARLDAQIVTRSRRIWKNGSLKAGWLTRNPNSYYARLLLFRNKRRPERCKLVQHTTDQCSFNRPFLIEPVLMMSSRFAETVADGPR
jgi:hypothetical protein